MSIVAHCHTVPGQDSSARIVQQFMGARNRLEGCRICPIYLKVKFSIVRHTVNILKPNLKVHKNENFFGFDFEFCTISLLVMSKY
jgi:hypothetical protein